MIKILKSGLLFIAAKAIEYSPIYFIFGRGKMLIWDSIDVLFETRPPNEQAMAIKFLKSYPSWLYLFFVFFVFTAPIFIGLITRKKKTIKNYWRFSTLSDSLFFLYILFAPCDPGMLIGLCGIARIFYFGLLILLIGLRSGGYLLAKKLTRD